MPDFMPQSSLNQTTCFESILKATQNLDSEALVIFDIDDVLITAKDHVLRTPHKEEWFDAYFNKKFSPQEVLQLSGYMWTAYETEITDPQVVLLHQNLKARKIPTIALTAGWNGPLGLRQSHCDDRVQSLQKFGLDFSESFRHLPETVFHGFENCGRVPSFKSGIIFTCMLPKAFILDAFLKAATYTPKTIIFIDDIRYNIENIKNYCENQKIPFHGFHYTGVAENDNKPLNNDIAHLQFQTVINNKIWLSDKEAEKLLQKKSH